MFTWDGSNVTDFIEDDHTILEEGVYEKKKYWIISNRGEKEVCLVRSATSSLPCLIDEIKPIFGLEKIGTHWFKFKGKIMILIRLEREQDSVLEELTLNEFGYNKDLEYEIQKIFVFRELLGISKSYEKSIILRNKKFFIKPISFYEPNMCPANCSKVIPDSVLEKWFKGVNIDQIVLKLIGVNSIENMNIVLSEIKSKMDQIVLRVDPNAVMHLDEIISRIRGRLQFILS